MKETQQLLRTMCRDIDKTIDAALIRDAQNIFDKAVQEADKVGKTPDVHKTLGLLITLPVESLAQVLLQRVKPLALLMDKGGISAYAQLRGQLIQEMDIAAFDAIRDFELGSTDPEQKAMARQLRKSLQDVGV